MDNNFPDLKNDNVDPFAEYYLQTEPARVERAYAWQTAIGLQDVDRLQTSDYLIKTAKDNIEGEISIEEAKKLVESYYEENIHHQPERTEEADKVAVRIAEILSENSFVFSPTQYMSIHQRLFRGIYSHAGKIRDCNLSKKEWVLNGESVTYGGALELRDTLDYDFQTERNFDYADMSMSEIIRHLALFVSRLWQIHIFREGNTRTTAVFFIKYLRTLGFRATNDSFAKHSWYFRNALVRANYTDLSKGIREDTTYLELFLRNLLMGEHNDLKNRYLHVNWTEQNETTHSEEKQHIKQHIEGKNNILAILETCNVSSRTVSHIIRLYDAFGNEKIFGRNDVMEITGLTGKPATTLIAKMHQILNLTEKMSGMGKGKYRFKI